MKMLTANQQNILKRNFSYKINRLLALALPLFLFAQCANVIKQADEWPEDLAFVDQEVVIGRGEAIILDIKKWITTPGEVLIHVKNASELAERFVLTDDGLLAYKADVLEEEDQVQIELEDEFGNIVDGRIDFQIENGPVLSSCNAGIGVDFVNLLFDPISISTEEFTSNNTACGAAPTNDFEIIFPTKELDVELIDGTLHMTPNPGGIGLDLLSYRGRLENDSVYMETILINNGTGCMARGTADDFNVSLQNSGFVFDLPVLENDEFCTFEMTDATIIEVSSTQYGTLEIIDGQYLKYGLVANPAPPLEETFSYRTQYKTLTGFSVSWTDCTLRINP